MFRIAEIEDAFVDKLIALRQEGVRIVDSYAEELTAEDVRRLVQRLPGVFVIFGGLEIETINQVDHVKVEVLVIVCDANFRSGREARSGAYYWLDRVRSLLHRKKVIDGFAVARCKNERILSADKQIVVCGATYEVVGRISL